MDIVVALQSLATPELDALTVAVTNLGSERAYIVLLVVTYLAIDARAGRTLGLTLLGGYYLNQQLKETFDTLRPFVLHPDLLRGGAAAAETAAGPAFPSGHAQSAATFWGLAALLARRRVVTLLAALMILAIGASRVYLGVHWPVDVAAGMAIGLAVAGAAYGLVRSRIALSIATRLLAFVVLPIGLHIGMPTPESGLLAGAIAAFGTAPMLHVHRARGGLVARACLVLLGLTLVFAWLAGSSLALPDVWKDHVLIEPARYLILGWAGLVAAPWLATHSGLLPRIGAR